MDIGESSARGFMGLLCLWIFLGAMVIPLQAGDRSVQLTNGEIVSSGGLRPGVPQAGRPLFPPPVFMDRSPPMSERPFARPFIDRSSPLSERPLPPIGGGAQVAPGSGPFIWCHGGWVRADNSWHGCPSR
jgi:hypothetical protein